MIRAPNCLQHHTQLKQPIYNRFVCHATIEKTPKLSNFYTEWMPKNKNMHFKCEVGLALQHFFEWHQMSK